MRPREASATARRIDGKRLGFDDRERIPPRDGRRPNVSFASELPLPLPVAPRTPGTSAEWPATVEEWEMLPADYEAG